MDTERMDEERLPKQILRWKSSERRKRVRPRTNWLGGIHRAMSERDLHQGDSENQKQWRLEPEDVGLHITGYMYASCLFIYSFSIKQILTNCPIDIRKLPSFQKNCNIILKINRGNSS
ncbi:unnamed protein product [Ceutorhynchus assimilis]|uniref:Uncharacterized protein n=1 Tax=Ceutorhynchus assimilis TaxID=467358 RepID=A0A9P0DBS9_9CUCU|nr:unnamed protein product [Ceutorhynchus assimilis]